MHFPRHFSLVSIAALAALCAPGFAQNDDCLTPTTIVGTGVFPFDDTLASTGSQGQANPFCAHIGNDIWYAWVAPTTGNASLATCGQAMFDTDIAVYNGPGCPSGPTNWCDDDACGLESFISWPAVAGNTYMLQIGGSGNSNSGTGTFTLGIVGPPANDDCSTPVVLGMTGGGTYDNSQATTSPQGSASCGQINNDLWYTWTASQTGTATIDTCGQSVMDTIVAAYLGSGCPTTGSIGCDDNGCGIQSMATFPIVAGATYTLQIGSPLAVGGPGSFIVTEQGGGGGSTGTPFCFGDGSGTACPCGNAGIAGHGCANSVNSSGAQLSATGGASVTGDSLVLQGSGMPANGSVLYYQGTAQTGAGAGATFGDGLRCASGSVVRLATRMNDATGASGYGGPLGDTPVSVRGQLPAGGGTREYQAWYRNAAAFCTPSTFNLTNGLEIVWAP